VIRDGAPAAAKLEYHFVSLHASRIRFCRLAEYVARAEVAVG
jgi:hypothetical protein